MHNCDLKIALSSTEKRSSERIRLAPDLALGKFNVMASLDNCCIIILQRREPLYAFRLLCCIFNFLTFKQQH